jgi:transposase
MRKRTQELTDEQWSRIKPLLPPETRKPKGGRRRADDRLVLEGILWVARTGARWRDLPDKYPSPATCWRRLKKWEEEGVWVEIWRAFLSQLDQRGLLDWEETFMDGSFVPAKKGAQESVRPSGVRERSGWWWSMARVFLWEASLNLPRQRK